MDGKRNWGNEGVPKEKVKAEQSLVCDVCARGFCVYHALGGHDGDAKFSLLNLAWAYNVASDDLMIFHPKNYRAKRGEYVWHLSQLSQRSPEEITALLTEIADWIAAGKY